MTCKKCNGRVWFNGRVGSQYELTCLMCGKLIWVKLNNPFGRYITEQLTREERAAKARMKAWLAQGRLRVIREGQNTTSSMTA